MNGLNNEAVDKFNYLGLTLQSTWGLNKQETLAILQIQGLVVTNMYQ